MPDCLYSKTYRLSTMERTSRYYSSERLPDLLNTIFYGTSIWLVVFIYLLTFIDLLYNQNMEFERDKQKEAKHNA